MWKDKGRENFLFHLIFSVMFEFFATSYMNVFITKRLTFSFIHLAHPIFTVRCKEKIMGFKGFSQRN